MVQNIAAQILNETPSQPQASVTATSEENTQSPQSTEPKTVNDFDEKFGVLAKMERKLRAEQDQWKNREKEWGEKDKKLSEYEELIKLLDENPLEALKKRKGWGVQEFNEFAVKHSTDEDLDPVAKLTKDFMSKLEERDKTWEQKLNEKIKAKEEEIAAKEYEGQIREFKSGIKTFLAENKDTYEFINAEESGADSVYELIYEDILRQKKEAEDQGIENPQFKVMDVKDAAEKVEAFLDKTYSKYLALNKVKSKIQPSNEVDLGRFITKSQPTTLNSSFSPKSNSVDQLSAEERKQAAIDFIRSQKN